MANPQGFSFVATLADDKLTVFLDNAAEIVSYQTLTFTIKPTTNPPSLAPISGFAVET